MNDQQTSGGQGSQDEPTVSTRRIHEGRIINLREDVILLPSGREAKREIVEHKGAVCVVPVLGDGRIVLVRQYRKPAEEALLEVPAGGLEVGESPSECASRELMEECGFRPGKLSPLYEAFLAPGYSTELMYAFVAEDLSEERAQADEDENVAVEIYTPEEIVAMMGRLEIRDAKTVSALALYLLQKNLG
jgi:ADP-ribose pyrophosphatase